MSSPSHESRVLDNSNLDADPAALPQTLDDWLAWQESLHTQDIELGLERSRAVALRMGLFPAVYTVVTVAGTNGKGSTVAMLESIFRHGGYRVATYTSPHLLRYNERIRLDGVPLEDAAICAAFVRVERARGATPLTYFEFGTLAALAIFQEAKPDIAILEVGLGGRLDAVNILDADVAVIATIDIDHVEWLGHTREAIAIEKAGIMRSGRPAVCSDPNVPQSLIDTARNLQAQLHLLGQSFYFQEDGDHWSWWSDTSLIERLPRPNLLGSYQLRNAAGVLQAVTLLQERHPVSHAAIATALTHTQLRGRFQRIDGVVEFILDVAHNAQAVEHFVATLKTLPAARATHVILGMLRTKDRRSAIRSLSAVVDHWHLGTVAARHGATADELAQTLHELDVRAPLNTYPSISEAYRGALAAVRDGDRIIVVGSFVTVGEVMRELSAASGQT